MSPTPVSHRRRRAGVTAFELLVAIGIAAILAMVSVAFLNRHRERSRETVCLSNLRNLGVAMALYTGENSMTLPGPLWRGQSPIYQSDEEGGFDRMSGNLVTFLAPYLRLENLPPLHSATAEILACPAWLKSARHETQLICYYSAGEIIIDPDEPSLFPFGRSSSQGEPLPPMRTTALPDPATTPAFWEFDRQATVAESDYFTDPRVPSAPVHRTVRNTLFFDGHVAASRVF
ncbi:MAG TPA: prepilin-type N-terminal cleavage/methylation domain-containing protein [Chthoniobacteraceae bacterium]|nr:prepilin-type N-terminal cleavage/methylation domain-containing protein [Chthoniobacteraceae bacterium]